MTKDNDIKTARAQAQAAAKKNFDGPHVSLLLSGADAASDVWEPIAAYWKDRAERAEESLRLTIDEGTPAW